MSTLRDQLQESLGSSYHLDRELGGGGMSRVFVATETALGRAVVIKVVPKLAARLQQANIVPLLSAGDANGVPFYTMPFVDGLSLRARLSSGPPLSLSEATHILRDVLKALAYRTADSLLDATIRLDSSFALIWSTKAEALLLGGEGRATEAVAILERRVAEMPPHRPSETHALLAYAYARAGMASKARTLLEEQRVDAGGKLPATGTIAATLELLGDHEGAVALLGEAVKAHDAWLVQNSRNEMYDSLRRDPRVAGLLAKFEAW